MAVNLVVRLVTRDRIVARFVLENVKRWIKGYRGPQDEIGSYILQRIEGYMDRIDLLLTDMLDDLTA